MPRVRATAGSTCPPLMSEPAVTTDFARDMSPTARVIVLPRGRFMALTYRLSAGDLAPVFAVPSAGEQQLARTLA